MAEQRSGETAHRFLLRGMQAGYKTGRPAACINR